MTIQMDRRLAFGLTVLVALAAGVLARAWILERRAPATVDSTSPAPSAMVATTPPLSRRVSAGDDLTTYCLDASRSADRLLGRARLQQLEAAVARLEGQRPAGGEALQQLTQAHFMLGVELLNQGEFDRVIGEYDESLRLAAATGASRQGYDELLLRRGVAHMRLAAVENCVKALSTFGCLSLAGEAGAFRRTEHTVAAIRDLEAVMSDFPQNAAARWLVNLAYMELGRYPDGVPRPWLIPPEAFASAGGSPAFINLAPVLRLDEVNLAGGSIMEDFDDDGRLDLFTTTYDPCDHARFYRNVGDGRLVEASAEAGLEDQLGGFSAQQTDFDNDGDMDVFILRGAWEEGHGRQRNSLLANDGSGHFTDVTIAAGLAEPAYPTQASGWADYDGDGYLDVYIGNEGETVDAGFPSQLFRNNGNGTFTDVASEAGVTNDRFAKGVAWGDYDNDGRPDLYVSNFGANRLFRNNGDGTFTDVAAALGVAAPVGRSFVPWFWDYNNDGWLDLFVAGYDATVANVALGYMGQDTSGGRPRLYRNDGQGGFDDVT
ncbi:MAG: FG-GAP-like repeat-containing protein, partial [Anaerolineae bacterium]